MSGLDRSPEVELLSKSAKQGPGGVQLDEAEAVLDLHLNLYPIALKSSHELLAPKAELLLLLQALGLLGVSLVPGGLNRTQLNKFECGAC